ncbi:uncharacterized protein LOC124198684 isoform X1 [Daphnia pulex]|uniref:uncharacterized protein LOC124198684 isoform X1 n=1 Tax=Daphnia pulex TaxID=6669 RepID=UPI001EDF84FB|nr:uncharacterized protein LOC124198684 isoform X1 [Daphnia pulex]
MIDNMSILYPLCSISGLYLQFLYILISSILFGVPVIATTTSSQLVKVEGSLSDFCEQWVAFKDPQTGRCLPCSPCPEDHLTVAKCEFDRDTLCRPLTDLAEHIESVVHSSSSVTLTKKNNTIVIVEQNTVFEHLLGGIEYSPALVVILSLVVFGCISYILMQSLKRCRRNQKQQHGLKDPLHESLLGQEEQDENDKPVLDMDEMLAQRFGRSLVTNVYVP